MAFRWLFAVMFVLGLSACGKTEEAPAPVAPPAPVVEAPATVAPAAPVAETPAPVPAPAAPATK